MHITSFWCSINVLSEGLLMEYRGLLYEITIEWYYKLDIVNFVGKVTHYPTLYIRFLNQSSSKRSSLFQS